MILGRHEVRRDWIPLYLDDYAISCVNIWSRWKKFGNPFDGGWAQQPAYLIDIIDVIDTEAGWRPDNAGSG